MIRVDIVNVFLTAKGDEFIILLHGPDDERTLPISIGQLEAQSIASQIYKVEFPRPLTHDLFKTTIERLGCTVDRAVISDLIDSTFYARLFLTKNGETIEIDSRPSDAIAIALRFKAQIFVDEKVMEESGIVFPEETANGQAQKKPEETDTLKASENLRDLLQKAIREERYEDAAHIRDRLNNLSKSN